MVSFVAFRQQDREEARVYKWRMAGCFASCSSSFLSFTVDSRTAHERKKNIGWLLGMSMTCWDGTMHHTWECLCLVWRKGKGTIVDLIWCALSWDSVSKSYNSERFKDDLEISSGDLLHVVDTYYHDNVGSWRVHRISEDGKVIGTGSVPCATR